MARRREFDIFAKNNIRVLPSSTLRTIISRATRGPKQPPKALKPFIAAAVASDWRQLVDSEIWRDSTFMAAFQKMVGFDIISRWASIWTLLKKILPLPGVCFRSRLGGMVCVFPTPPKLFPEIQ